MTPYLEDLQNATIRRNNNADIITFAAMEAVIIAGIAICSLLLLLLISKSQKLIADRFLIIYFVYFILAETYFYIESFGVLEYSTWMILGKGLYLLAGPLLFHYVYALTNAKPLSRPLYIATLAPFLLYVIIFFYYDLRVFDNSNVQIRNGLLYFGNDLSIMWAFLILLFIISEPFYLVLFYFQLKRYRNRLLDATSNAERLNFAWLRVLFWIWVITSVVLVPASVLSLGRPFISQADLDLLIHLSSFVFIFVAGYYGFRQARVFSEERSLVPGSVASHGNLPYVPYAKSGLTRDELMTHHQRLLALMENEKPYLNGELGSSELAALLSITPNHLSQVLSQVQRQNFFDFVNSYRVDEVKKKLADPSFNHYTLLGIALESGFSSKTSFNTVFKKLTGQTPGQFHKTLKNGLSIPD
ncbi:MAG TPA: helix-turn-helix domain-containing protein [Chryseosolibacter sp.]|nr:helix-turn-helix domain-containing protein [Chryseosolibacter sp.]